MKEQENVKNYLSHVENPLIDSLNHLEDKQHQPNQHQLIFLSDKDSKRFPTSNADISRITQESKEDNFDLQKSFTLCTSTYGCFSC